MIKKRQLLCCILGVFPSTGQPARLSALTATTSLQDRAVSAQGCYCATQLKLSPLKKH